MSILYAPLIFLLWLFIYWVLYLAARGERSWFYTAFFIGALFELFVCLFFFVGIPATATSGLGTMAECYIGQHLACGILGTVSAVTWLAFFLFSLITLIQMFVRRGSKFGENHPDEPVVVAEPAKAFDEELPVDTMDSPPPLPEKANPFD